MQDLQHRIFTLILIGITVAASLKGFRDRAFLERFIFWPEAILAGKDWRRMFTSAFLHADVFHLGMNMYVLYLFGGDIEEGRGSGLYGPAAMLLIYFSAVLGGSGLSLWLHRNHDYRAYGASGGACGLVLAHVFLFPGSSYGLILIPVYIPAWAFLVLFLGITIFGVYRHNWGDIGHDAHLGGALVGLLVTTAMFPEQVMQQNLLWLAVMAVGGGFLWYLWRNPLLLPARNVFGGGRAGRSRVKPARPRRRRRGKGGRPSGRGRPGPIEQAEIDRVLDKISAEGLGSLTDAERALLESASKNRRRS